MATVSAESATPSRDALVVPLQALDRSSLPLAGGKGANLGELVRARFPVPAGFVATTAAYDLFVVHNRLAETITRAFTDQTRDGEVEEGSAGGNGDRTGAAIRHDFESAAVPNEVERGLLAAYRELGQGAVAVRSSATAEDLPEAAFAGQHDTLLNVLGEQSLVDAVRSCWASLWTDRAIAYRRRLGIDQGTVKLAVVVQRMVTAEAAGVMFTADPVTGSRDVVTIDASPGLGEAVVAGAVTPDHIVVHKRSGRVKERLPGYHEVMVRARPEGGTEQVEGPLAREAPVLPDGALRRLAYLGRAIERHFGGPQDIEWAWDGRDLFILQARPITALAVP
ncbi:MAG: phosphoenolpyruvate synthase, partial [Actinomycetota bacterium]|nr:phosphoenolpyruvate synthase [Actinomycetota bacterium]